MQMEYLSSSRISLFNQCPLSFRTKYLDRGHQEDRATEWYGDYGSLMHDIYETIAKKGFDSEWRAIQHYDINFRFCFIPDDKRAEYYQQGLDSIKRKYNELLNLNIVDIEKEFIFILEFGVPPLHGFIDLIYQDERGLVVRDYKTSKPYTNSEMSQEIQPYMYALACEQLYGQYPYKFEYDFVRFNEKKTLLINDTFMQLAQIKMKANWNRIKTSDFPANFSPFFCNEFCQSRSTCPTYMKKLNI